MTPEAQRIAIAEACGLKNARQIKHSDQVWADNPRHPPHSCLRVQVPDFLNDLNAMHEAEKVLTEQQQATFALFLHGLSKRNRHDHLGRYFDCIHATAAQRAEALLRTIGKWKDAQ